MCLIGLPTSFLPQRCHLLICGRMPLVRSRSRNHRDNPSRDLLEQPRSDFFYYVLRLSELLADLTRYTPLQLPDDYYGQLIADGRSIMVHQARFLIAHGSAEVLTLARRQFLYGDDVYIARRIANYLRGL